MSFKWAQYHSHCVWERIIEIMHTKYVSAGFVTIWPQIDIILGHLIFNNSNDLVTWKRETHKRQWRREGKESRKGGRSRDKWREGKAKEVLLKKFWIYLAVRITWEQEIGWWNLSQVHLMVFTPKLALRRRYFININSSVSWSDFQIIYRPTFASLRN